jgi:hypothetical protein
MAKFSETQPAKQEMETDRSEFRAGDVMRIMDIAIVESHKYGRVGKVNGTDDRNTPVKKRTTSKVLVEQLQNIRTHDQSVDGAPLMDPVDVRVEQVKSESAGRMYLTFVDP